MKMGEQEQAALSALLKTLRSSGHAEQPRMLPPGCFTLPAFFDFEREAIFARSWICVGRADQIPEPGDSMPAKVADEPLIVVRGEDGCVRALSAVCQHRGEVIPCEGGKVRGFRCPLHFWSYDLEGRLVAAPRMGGRATLQCL